MKNKDKQRELNIFIQDELNRIQIYRELGLVYLGKDKDARKQLYPYSIGKRVFEGTGVISVICAIVNSAIDFITSHFFSVAILISISISIIIVIGLYYIMRHKTVYNDILYKKEKVELEKACESVGRYLDFLSESIRECSCNVILSNEDVARLSGKLSTKKEDIAAVINKMSLIFGRIKDEDDKRARDFAESRIKQLVPHFFEYYE